jgi:hypothetical protein
MQDHRQIEPARQLQLRTVNCAAAGSVHRQKNPASPMATSAGHDGAAQRLGQQRQVGIGRPRV